MPRWNTNQVIADLQVLLPTARITNQGPGGDVDTDNLHIGLLDCSDSLFVCGFDDANDITTPGDVDVPFLELTDGLDSRGGLNSYDGRVAQAYMQVRQYFLSKGFVVCPTLKDYF